MEVTDTMDTDVVDMVDTVAMDMGISGMQSF